VVFSVLTSRRAPAEATQARKETTKAQSDALKAAEAQAEESRRISETERELEQDRRAYSRRVDAERKATRQAADVRVATEWELLPDSSQIAPDWYANVGARVINDSGHVITDVRLR
jgi:hypothetical protein